jgi:hypothetical protein
VWGGGGGKSGRKVQCVPTAAPKVELRAGLLRAAAAPRDEPRGGQIVEAARVRREQHAGAGGEGAAQDQGPPPQTVREQGEPTGWSAGRLVGLVGLVGWLVGWLVGRQVDR